MSMKQYTKVIQVTGASDTLYFTNAGEVCVGSGKPTTVGIPVQPRDLPGLFQGLTGIGVAQKVLAAGGLVVHPTEDKPWALDWSLAESVDVGSNLLLIQVVDNLNNWLNEPAVIAATATPAATSTQATLDPIVVGSKTYIPRWWDVFADWDVNVLRKAIRSQMHVHLVGSPGCGKTLLTQAAAGPGLEVAVGSEGMDRSDLMGQGNFNEKGQVVYVPGALPKAATHRHDSQCERDKNGDLNCGKSTILFDEANGADPRVAMLMNPWLDGRSVVDTVEYGLIEISPDFVTVLNTNPDIAGLYLSPALESRMTMPIIVQPDFSIGQQMGVNPKAIQWAEALLLRKNNGEPVGELPSLRLLDQFKDMEAIFGEDIAWRNMMGKATASAVKAWVDVAATEVGVDYPGMEDGLVLR